MRLLASLLGLLIFLFSTNTILAADKFINIVNPIRGKDYFQLKEEPKENVQRQFSQIYKRNLPATWLLRPDALNDNGVLSLVKSFPKTQEIGLFMEITSSWTKEADVAYRNNENWHEAGSVFLTGYEVAERKKLIDFAFSKFKNIFGYYPKSVGAWWIDAGSLMYMKDKYGVIANMDVADQYTTDNYQVWGQYFSTPFYPAKRNALVPASGVDQKLGIVTIQWAARDPFNSFGNGVLDSTYSVQANDYSNKKFHNLDINYFNKLISIYLDNPYANFGHVTVGLENDFSWDEFGAEYERQLDSILQRQKNGNLVSTMSDFAENYFKLYPGISPPQIIFAADPLGSKGSVVWYQTSKYRMGLFFNNIGSVVRDLRLYFDSHDEPCLSKPCLELNLAMIESKNLDEVSFNDRWIIDEGKINNINVKEIPNGIEITYINQANIKRTLEFLPNDIKVDGHSKPIPVVIAEAIDSSKNTSKIIHQFGNNLFGNVFVVLIEQMKYLLIFLIFLLIFFYLPGAALLKRVDISKNEKFVLSIVLGIVILTLFSFVFGFMKFYWGVLILPLFSILYLRKDLNLKEFSLKINLNKNFLVTSIIIFFGSLSWLSTTIKNGLIYDYGMGFWGPNGHDAIWHLGLAEVLKKGLPPQNAVFSSEILKNYHYFYDLLLSVSSLLTRIPTNDLYFRYFPLILAIFVGILGFMFVRRLTGSNLAANLSVFFIYFGGSFGWVVSYFKDKSFGGESLFWAQQSISTLLNPPLAISLVIFLAGLYLFYEIFEKNNKGLNLKIALIILWGSLIEFKAYAGILVLGSLILLSLYKIFKKDFSIFKISIPATLLSAILFLPNNSGSNSLLVFSPFWLVHSMIDSADRVAWTRLSLTRVSGFENKNIVKIIFSETLGLLIFIFGNLGTRLFGLFYFKNILKKNPLNIFIFFFIILSLIIPLLFIQKGGSFNTIQFFYYFIFVFNLLAGIILADFIKKFEKLKAVIIVTIILLTIPTTMNTLNQYLPERPPARVSRAEIDALNFLSSRDDGIVLSFYFDEKLKDRYIEPRPLFAYESTGYVSAYSKKSEFIADTVNLNIIGIDYKGRSQSQKDIFALKEPEVIKKLLKENKIKYIYAPKISNFTPDQESFSLKSIFKNSEVEIFENINLARGAIN